PWLGASARMLGGSCTAWKPATESLYDVSRASPGIVVPLSTSVVTSPFFSGGAFGAFGLRPSATSVERVACVTSGCRKESTAVCTSAGCASSSALAMPYGCRFWRLTRKRWPAGSLYASPAYDSISEKLGGHVAQLPLP